MKISLCGRRVCRDRNLSDGIYSCTICGVEVLAEVDGRIVGVRYGKQLAVAFHPELGGDHRIHQWFLEEFIKQ